MTKLLAISAAMLVALATTASAMFTLKSAEDVDRFLERYNITEVDPTTVTDHQKVALSQVDTSADVSRLQIRAEIMSILASDK